MNDSHIAGATCNTEMKLRAFTRLIGRKYIPPNRSDCFHGAWISSGSTQHYEHQNILFGVIPIFYTEMIVIVFAFEPQDKRYKSKRLAIEMVGLF